MPVTPDLLERCGDLKKRLVDFAEGSGFRGERERWIARYASRGGRPDVGKIANALDSFVLEHRFPDGRGVVDRFLEAHPELPTPDAALMIRWKEVAESLFRVARHERKAVIFTDLVNDLEHRVYSNFGAVALAALKPGVLLHARLVPIDDEWLVSGYLQTFRPEAGPDLLRAAAEIAQASPQHLFRNPVKLAEAQALQRRHRQEFIDLFGTDTLTVAGREVPETMRRLLEYQMFEARGPSGLTPAESYQREHPGAAPAVPEQQFDPDLLRCETVGIICDEAEGLSLFPEMARVEAAFAEPELARRGAHQKAVIEYVESPGLSPLPLRRLAERYPEGATLAVRNAFPDLPDFLWERDGEGLMLSHKPDYREAPLPSVAPLSDELSEAVRQARAPAPTPSRARPGRNEPCLCGSGRKYKHCCARR